MEHRDVAFDVMKQVGDVPEATRRFALLFTTVMMFGFTLYRTDVMLKTDGFNLRQRFDMARKGLPWFFGRNGILTAKDLNIVTGLKDFHPNQHPVIRQYDVWIDTLAKTNDPIAAGEAFWQAGL
jgi:predicted metal-dependent hydrolase